MLHEYWDVKGGNSYKEMNAMNKIIELIKEVKEWSP